MEGGRVMGKYAINHCQMEGDMKKAGMDKEDVMEAIMERSGTIVASRLAGKEHEGQPHNMPGVELVARVVAGSVMKAGAERLADDFGINLAELKKHAASEHISSC